MHDVLLAADSIDCCRVMVVKRRKLLRSLSRAKLHKILDSLLACAGGFVLVQRSINHLARDALEFAVGTEIDLNVCMLVQKLADQLEDAKQCLMKSAFLHLGAFRHSREVRFDQGTKLNLSLNLVLAHLRVVVKLVHVLKAIVQLDVGHALVVHQGLEADNTKVWKVHGALVLDLAIDPSNDLN